MQSYRARRVATEIRRLHDPASSQIVGYTDARALRIARRQHGRFHLRAVMQQLPSREVLTRESFFGHVVEGLDLPLPPMNGSSCSALLIKAFNRHWVGADSSDAIALIRATKGSPSSLQFPRADHLGWSRLRDTVRRGMEGWFPRSSTLESMLERRIPGCRFGFFANHFNPRYRHLSPQKRVVGHGAQLRFASSFLISVRLHEWRALISPILTHALKVSHLAPPMGASSNDDGDDREVAGPWPSVTC